LTLDFEFAGALENCIYRRKEEIKTQDCVIITLFAQSPFSPISPNSNEIVTPKKEGGRFVCAYLLVVYRFLSIRMSTAPTTTIAIMIPVIPGRMYRSAIDAGMGVGSAVAAGASSTFMPVSAYDP
jgi:hypothetical protein